MREVLSQMRFRPCIDIHNGKVKQIIGGTLRDRGDQAEENFVSDKDGAWFAGLYREYGLSGGHIILLNPVGSPHYEDTRAQAMTALAAWPGGLQIGGGITADNAAEFLAAGASHVIVTSYVFREGRIHRGNLDRLVGAVGPEKLVLDLSCRRKEGAYYIVTDRWQTFTDIRLTPDVLRELSSCCSEFLVHAVDREGKVSGIEAPVAELLGEYAEIPCTYAGGVGCYKDLELLRKKGRGRVDVTVGSALDLFGGPLEFERVLAYCR